jgi:hypothetical protein
MPRMFSLLTAIFVMISDSRKKWMNECAGSPDSGGNNIQLFLQLCFNSRSHDFRVIVLHGMLDSQVCATPAVVGL